MSDKKFHYVIGKLRGDNNPGGELCIYAYHTEVHYSDMKTANELLDYVFRHKENTGYSIYKINFEKL